VTLDKHMALLEGNPELREIYGLFSGLIAKKSEPQSRWGAKRKKLPPRE
jgi:hypothetical protein